MTHQKILEKAIEKAIDGGWDKNKAAMLESLRTEKAIYWQWVKHSFIYNHDFAKALWGEELPEEAADYYYGGPDENYLWHLQQMVISDDPIEYLGDNI